jgi:hypothetical protein
MVHTMCAAMITTLAPPLLSATLPFHPAFSQVFYCLRRNNANCPERWSILRQHGHAAGSHESIDFAAVLWSIWTVRSSSNESVTERR